MSFGSLSAKTAVLDKPMQKGVFMKKSVLVILSATLALLLFGCSEKTAENTGGTEQSEQLEQTEQPGQSATEPEEDEDEAATPAQEPQPYVKTSGWTFSDSYVNFGAIIENTDTVNCYVLMPLSVTAKDADGKILANSVFTVEWIAPNDIMPVHGVLTNVASEPAEVTFDFSFSDGSKPGNDYTLADMKVTNITDTGTKITGEYENATGCDFPNGVTLLAVFWMDGKIVGSCNESMEYSNPCQNGSKSAFELVYQFSGAPEHDSVDVYAIPNLLF
ncbi:MAG: hypothetical protein IJC51_01610 [Eggerthellaceae bacterium]|nr:hypothetical protein [Eggerthellaceae bacterium]